MPDEKPSLFRQQLEGAKRGLPVTNRLSPVKNSDYTPQLGEGNVFLGGDLNSERARKMGTLEQTGKFLGNTISNSVTGLLESAGHLSNLVTQWGDERNYDNALIQTMNDWKNPFGEIYRENPEQTFDLGDPAWWLNNASGLISSVAQFAAVGMGVGSVMAKGASMVARAGLLSSDAAAVTGQTLTAATLAYTEGAMSARNVFTKVYQKQLNEGLYSGLSQEEAEERARHMAAQGASTTAQINTALGTLLNLGSVSPMFRDLKSSSEFFRSGAGRRQAGETLEAYSERLSALSRQSPELRHLVGGEGMSHLLKESGKEGLEEVMNQFTEATGEDTGNRGESGNFFRQFREILDTQKTWEKVVNEEGLLNFMLGAAGGVGNTMVMEYTPTPHNKIGEDGTLVPKLDENGEMITRNGKPVYEKAFYNSRFLDENRRFRYFENRRDAVLKDVQTVTELQAEINKAIQSGDRLKAQQLTDKLTGTHHLNALLNGTAENWVQEYESYRDLDNQVDLGEEHLQRANELAQQVEQLKQEGADPDEVSALEAELAQESQLAQQLAGQTEAMQRGFALSKEDNAYKQKAEQSIQDLRKAEQLYKETEKQFKGYSEENNAYNLVATVMAKKLDAMFNERMVQEFEGVAAQASLSVSADKSLLMQLYNQMEDHKGRTAVFEQLKQGLKAKDTKALRSLLAGQEIEFEDSEQGILQAARESVQSLYSGLSEEIEQQNQMAELLKETDEFQAWAEKHKDGSLADYASHLMENTIEAKDYNDLLKQLTEAKNKVRVNQFELDRINLDPARYVRSIVRDAKGALKKQQELDDFMAAEENRRNYESQVLRDRRSDQLLKEAEELKDQLDELNTEIESHVERLQKHKARTPSKLTERVKYHMELRRLNQAYDKLVAKRKSLQAQIDRRLEEVSRLTMMAEQAAPPVENAPVKEEPEQEPEENTPEAPAGNLQQNVQTFRELVDMHALNSSQAEAELYGYVAQPDSFPRKIGQTFKFAPQAVQAQLYQLTKAIVDEVRANTNRTAEIEDEAEEVLDEETSFGMEQKNSSPADKNQNKAERTLKKELEGVVKITADVSAKANPDGSLTISIAQGKGQQPITIHQRKWGAGFTYTVNEGSFLEPLKGKEAKRIAQAYLQDEGTSLQEINEKLGTHTQQAKAKYQQTVKSPAPTTDALPDGNGDISLPLDDSIYAASVVMNPNIDLDLDMLDGAKRLSAVSPIANHLAYKEITHKDGRVTRENATNSLNQDANLKVLVPGYLKVNDKVEFSLDMDANRTNTGLGMTDEAFNPLQSPQDPNQLVEDVGEAPIKITKNGETIGHLMTIRRLNEKVGDSYANVEVLENFTDPESYERAAALGVRSIEDLNQELLQLRQNVLDNQRQGFLSESSIQEVGDGMVLYNTTQKTGGGSRIDPQSAALLLPDTALQLGITYQGKAYTSFKTAQPVINAIQSDSYGVGALIPTAAGNYRFEPLRTNKLADHQIETMWEVLKLYAQKDQPQSKAQLQQIKKLTGFDVSTGVGLRAFISQYYITPTNFTEADLVESDKQPILALAIGDGMMQDQQEKAFAKIKIAITGMMRGMKIQGTEVKNKPIYLTDSKGNINPEFEQVFKARMRDKILQATHEFNLSQKYPEGHEELQKYGSLKDYKGVNSTGKITELIFHEGEFLVRKEHKDYNSYLKENATTVVNGTNKVGSSYVYTVHPQVRINPDLQVGAQVDPDVATKVEVHPDGVDLTENAKQHPLYGQLEALFRQTRNPTRSMEDVLQEAIEMGFEEEWPDFMGNPFEETC